MKLGPRTATGAPSQVMGVPSHLGVAPKLVMAAPRHWVVAPRQEKGVPRHLGVAPRRVMGASSHLVVAPRLREWASTACGMYKSILSSFSLIYSYDASSLLYNNILEWAKNCTHINRIYPPPSQ